jgi:hypothetical protein
MMRNETFRKIALAFPGAVEAPHFDRTSFRANKKIFATLQEKTGIACLLLSEIDQSAFCACGHGAIYPVPNKWGQKGATYFALKELRKEIVQDALQVAYEKIMPKKRPAAKRAKKAV